MLSGQESTVGNETALPRTPILETGNSCGISESPSTRSRTIWRRRRGTLERIVRFQNEGKIIKIYTLWMAAQLRMDLDHLRREYNSILNVRETSEG